MAPDLQHLEVRFEICVAPSPPICPVHDSSCALPPPWPQPANYLLPSQKQPSQGAILARMVKICNKLLVKLLEKGVAFQDSQTSFCTSPWEMRRGMHIGKN